MAFLPDISPRVIASGIGAGAGTVVSTLIFWLIGVLAYGVAADAGSVATAIASVPTPVSAAVGLILIVVGSVIAGYQTTDPRRVPERALTDESGLPVISE